MKFSITRIGQSRRIRGGQMLPINTDYAGCSSAITTRYEASGLTNILSTTHFPMTVILIEYEPIFKAT